MRKHLFSIAALAAVLVYSGCSARVVRAQYIGTVSPQTVTQNGSASCTGSIQLFPVTNLGQTQHYFSITSNTSGLVAQVFGIVPGANPAPISDTAMPQGSNTVTLLATSYYQQIELQVACNSATGSFQWSYTGTSATSNVLTGTFLDEQLDKYLNQNVSAASGFTINLTPPSLNSSGLLFLSGYSGGPPSVTVTCETIGTTVLSNYVLSIPSSGIALVPPSPCPTEVVAYTPNGATGSTLKAEYHFFLPGLNGEPMAAALNSPISAPTQLAEKGPRWLVPPQSSPAAGTQATASKAALANTYHVADCISFSAGAIAAPTATQLTVNLRNGATGAGTVIWSKTIEVPATTGMHASESFCGLNLIGSVNTAMTLEFSAGLASESESVTLTGYDVQ